MLEKYASQAFTVTVIISITGYVLLMNSLIPATNAFVK